MILHSWKKNQTTKGTMNYPDKQTVLSVWEEGRPYSRAFSSSSFVEVTLLTGGEAGLGAETTSYSLTKQQTPWVHNHQTQHITKYRVELESNFDFNEYKHQHKHTFIHIHTFMQFPI